MNASSESGLCAMLISRTCEDWLPVGFTSCSEITVISDSKLLLLSSRTLWARTTPPPRGDAGSHHHLNYLCKQKPIKAPAEGLRHGMRKHGKPAQTCKEKHDLAEKAAQRGTGKATAAALHHKSGKPRYERISQQKSAGGAEQLGDSSRACGIEYRHAQRALREIKRKHRKSAPAAEEQADQENSEVLSGQRYGRKGQRNRDSRAQSDE